MAVRAAKGSGIGQVTIPSAADYLRAREGYVSGIGEAAAPYFEGIAGRGDKAGDFLSPISSAEQMFGKPTTRFGALLQGIADVPLTGLEAVRKGTGYVSAATNPFGNFIGDYLDSPTDTEMAKIISQEGPAIESQISAFREQARRMGQDTPEGMSYQDPTPGSVADEADAIIESLKQKPETPPGGSNASQDPSMSESSSTSSTESSEGQTSGGAEDRDIDDPFADIIAQAMANVEEVRDGQASGKSIDEYKKDFAAATGVDISGKADKSHALMAFGLALMQNKAGKGFNVGEMLSSVGEAGEKAMPLIAAARKEARANQLAAGQFALGRVARDDQAKAARLAAAQKAVADLRSKQSDFYAQLLLQRDEQLFEAAQTKLEHENAMARSAAEGFELYTDKIDDIPLFKDAPEVLNIKAFIENPNLPAGVNAPIKLTDGSYRSLKSELPAMEKSLNKTEAELRTIKRIVENEGIDVTTQIGSVMKSAARGLGFNLDQKLDPVAQARIMLQKIQAQKTAEILGEAGKTISDADRALVERIVGKIDLSPDGADPQVLLQKIDQVYSLIVEKGRSNLDTAYGKFYGTQYEDLVPQGYIDAQRALEQQVSDEELSAEDRAELEQLRKS